MLPSFAFFGPSEKHSVPSGGFCLSVFAIIKKGERILLVKPRDHPRWTEEWAPNWNIYQPERAAAEKTLWRFPSSYIKEGESPDDTLARLMRDQLGITRYSITSSKLFNFYSPSSRYPERKHWDYSFVYQVNTAESVKSQPWFSEVDYVDTGSLNENSFGSAQGDLAKELGMV